MTQEQILFFEESYTKYYRMMVQTVLPIVGSRDIAEDIVADTFLILLAKINSVMEHEQPVKWLFRVLKNNAISEYRAQCRHAAAPLEESISACSRTRADTVFRYAAKGLIRVRTAHSDPAAR